MRNEADSELISKASRYFPGLSTSERLLLNRALAGEGAVCGQEPYLDPRHADQWTSDRVIRSEFFTWLCGSPEAQKHITPKGIELVGAKFQGFLDLSYARIPFPLKLIACAIPGGFSLIRAQSNDLYLSQSHVGQLVGYFMDLRGDLILSEGFASKGGARFDGADVSGRVVCSGGRFESPAKGKEYPVTLDNDVALSLSSATISGSVYLDECFEARGQVRLTNTSINEELVCSGGRFQNRTGFSLACMGICVGGDVCFDKGFRSLGELRIIAAKVGGDLICDDASLIRGSGCALVADRIKVDGDIVLSNCRVSGTARIIAGEVGGDMDCEGTHFISDKATAGKIFGVSCDDHHPAHDDKAVDTWESGLDAEYLIVKRRLRWKKVTIADRTSLVLFHARVGSLADDEASWPKEGRIVLDGFAYDSISAGPTDAESRIRWLEKQKPREYFPQPYEQLTRCLRRSGWDLEAKQVGIAKQERRRKYGRLGRWEFLGHTVLKITIGYGYRPYWALGWGAAIVVLGWLIFSLGNTHDLLASTKDVGPIRYSPFVYSLDTFLPIIDLRQGDYWVPAADKGVTFVGVLNLKAGGLLRIYYWLHVALGWILTTLGVAGVTGLVRKD